MTQTKNLNVANSQSLTVVATAFKNQITLKSYDCSTGLLAIKYKICLINITIKYNRNREFILFQYKSS